MRFAVASIVAFAFASGSAYGQSAAPQPATAPAAQQATTPAAQQAPPSAVQKKLAEIATRGRAELQAAFNAIGDAAPPGSIVRQGPDDTVLISTPSGQTREPQGEAELAAYAAYREARERLKRDIEETAITYGAPLRILPDAAEGDRAGVARSNASILAQTLVFNRAARLTSELVATQGRNTLSLPAGTTMFVVDAVAGREAYCLPSTQRRGLFGIQTPWIPCYFDTDGDGALDRQTSGGQPLMGVHMFASGFVPAGEVTTPAKAEPIPYLEGYKQRVGITFGSVRYRRGQAAHEGSLLVWVGPDDNQRITVQNTGEYFRVNDGETKVVEVQGAKVELTSAGRELRYRVIETMPQQPFGIQQTVVYY